MNVQVLEVTRPYICLAGGTVFLAKKNFDDDSDDDHHHHEEDELLFMEWLTDRKRMCLISIREHCQRLSKSQISDKPRAGLNLRRI